MDREYQIANITDVTESFFTIVKGTIFNTKGWFLDFTKNGSLVRIGDGILSNKTRLDVPVAKGFCQGLLGIAVTNQSASYNILMYFFIIQK